MLQMLLMAGSAAAVAWLLFSKKKADADVANKEKQTEKTTTDKADAASKEKQTEKTTIDKADVVKPTAEDNHVTPPVTSSDLATAIEKPSSVDNRVAQVVTSAEIAEVLNGETKPAEPLIIPVASTQQMDQAPVAPITAEAPPPPQYAQQIQQEVPVAPSPVQAPPPAPIQEIPIAAPQVDLASPAENLDEVPVEMASPASAILVPQVLATPVFETAPFPPVNLEAPPPIVAVSTELTSSLLAPQDAQQIQQEVPVAPLPVQTPPPAPIQAPPPAPIQEIPIAAQLDLASPENLDEIPVEMASPAPAILVPQVLATPEPELVIPVEFTSSAPLFSVSEAPPSVVGVSPVLSTDPASNEEAPLPPIAAPVDSAPVSPQHQPEAEKKDSQGALSSDHLIVSKPTADQEQTADQPPSSPAAASPEKDVMTALDIDSDMVPEPQVMTARETPSTPISTAKEVTDVKTAVSPSQMM